MTLSDSSSVTGPAAASTSQLPAAVTVLESSLLVVMKMLNKDGQLLIIDCASVKNTIQYFMASTRDFVSSVVTDTSEDKVNCLQFNMHQ